MCYIPANLKWEKFRTVYANVSLIHGWFHFMRSYKFKLICYIFQYFCILLKKKNPSNIYFLEVKNEMHIVCMLIKKSQDISLTVAKKPFQDCLW